MAADYFLSLKRQIDEEYHLLSLGLSAFSDEELSETLYKRFSQQIDYLQNLFDNISVEAKNLDLDQSNPELYKLLEAKQEISDCYGQFNRQKNIFYKRFAKFRNVKEDDLIRSRMEPEPEADPEEEIPEELPEDLPEILDLEEEPDPEAEAAAKAEERKARQKKLAAEAKKRDEQYQANRLRQEEAARLGFSVHPAQPVSEAETQYERIRQEEQRQQETARETARIQKENEALRSMQERVELAEHLDYGQSSQIDTSREDIGHYQEVPGPQRSDVSPNTEPMAFIRQEEQRQLTLAAEAEKEDSQYQANRLRQEEAARLGFLAHPDQPVSEADIQHERIRQEEQRQQEAARETARIQKENEALRSMQERMEQAEHFNRVQSSHIDMSREGIGHHSEAPDSQKPDAAPNADPMASIREEYCQQETAREPSAVQTQVHTAAHTVSTPEERRPAEHFSYEQRSDEPSFKTAERPSESFPYSTAPESPPRPEESRPFAPDISPTPQNEYARSAHAEDASQQSQVHPESYAASAVNPGYIPRREDYIPEKPSMQEMPTVNMQQASHENTFTGRSTQNRSEDRAEGHFSKDAKDLPHFEAPSSFHVHTPGVMHESPGAPKMQAEPDPVPTSAIPERPAQPNPPYGYESRDSRYGPYFRAPEQEQKPTAAPVQAKTTQQPEPEQVSHRLHKGIQSREQGREVGAFVPYQFTPFGVAPVAVAGKQIFDKAADSNTQIYSALMANRSESGEESVQVSPALETQMRFNVERARMACADAKGTMEAPAAVHEYIEQRNAWARYRSAVREGKVRVSEPPSLTPAAVKEPADARASSIPGRVGNGPAAVYAFTPTGTTAKTIEDGKPTGNSYVFYNKGLPGKPAYTSANPMIVTNQYEEAITRKMRMATASLDAAIASGEPKAHSVNPQDVKMYTDAYLAFQKAKRDGTVVVSEDGKGHNTPDYFSWQQQRLAQKTKSSAAGGMSGNLFSGMTGQSLGPNPNKTQKKTVDETSAHIFNRDSLLRRQSLASIYAKQLGTRFQYWATGATFNLSRHMYHMVQSGDDNALRTMETGRYYITTATGVVLVSVSTAPVEKLGKRIAHATSREFHMYGTRSFLTNSELSAAVNNGLRTTRELDARISRMEAQLASMKEKMRTSNLDKYSQHQFEKLSSQLEQLKGERASAAKSLSIHQKLKSLRNEAKMEAELHKMLEKDGSLPKNTRKIRESAERINRQFQAEMQKKYGAYTFMEKGKRVPLLKASDKSLKAEIADIKLYGSGLKARIKELEAKGALLTAKERRLLMDLKVETKRLGRELGRLEGLSRDRAKLAFWNKKLDAMIKNASKNWQRARGGLFALQGFMIRPLQVGAESNTEGLAAAIRVASNRYVHILVKKSFKASMFLVKGTMNLVAPGSVQAMETTVFMVKTSIQAQAGLASNAIRSSVRTGVRAVGKAISSAVPPGVKTGVKSVVSAGNAVKGKYHGIVNGIKQLAKDTKVWFYKTSVGRGVSAVARFNKSTAEAIKAALSLLKGAALKGIAIFALIFVLIGLISLGFGMSTGMTGGSVIAAPDAGADGKIDLSPYMEIINREQSKFQNRIDGYMNNSKYDEVYLNYSGPMTNTKHILSMMAVRMSQNLDLDKNPEIEDYVVSLFHDSHKISTKTVERTCSGCKKREEYVQIWNSNLRQWEYVYVWDEDQQRYVRETETIEYCPGHTDLYIDVSILVFDEIFTADSYGNAGHTANAGQKIGDFKITYYCIENYPHICNDGDASNTATGTVPTPGRTIAVDPDVIPLGTHVIIDGHEYIAEDTGGAINGNRIDIVVAKHKEALEKGTRYNVPVYYPSYEGGSYEDTGKWDGWTEENIEWCKVIYNMPWHELYTGYYEYGSVVDSGELVVSGDFMWPVSCTNITSPFGPRNAPVAGASTFHKGVDIGVGTGTPVHAAADGTVIVSAYDSAAGYYMAINHGNGIVTRYLHNSVLNFNVGDTVKQGDIITYSGATGIGTGAHLHFEFIVNGTPIDPCVQFSDVNFTGNWDNPYS